MLAGVNKVHCRTVSAHQPPQTHPSTPKLWAKAALPPCTPSSNFLLLFLTLFSAKSKNLLFHGEQSILICLKPMFHFEFSFFLLIYTQAHIFICKHDIKDIYSGKQRNVSHYLNMPLFWRVLLPEEKFTEFPLVWLNSFKCCASRQTENLAYPQVPPLCSTFNRSLLWPQERRQPLLKL